MRSQELNTEYSNLMARLGQAAYQKAQLDTQVLELQDQINKLSTVISEGHVQANELHRLYFEALKQEASTGETETA